MPSRGTLCTATNDRRTYDTPAVRKSGTSGGTRFDNTGTSHASLSLASLQLLNKNNKLQQQQSSSAYGVPLSVSHRRKDLAAFLPRVRATPRVNSASTGANEGETLINPKSSRKSRTRGSTDTVQKNEQTRYSIPTQNNDRWRQQQDSRTTRIDTTNKITT